MAYKTLIGLEIHTELMTATKMYCGCKNSFGGEANTHCCPVCIGLPGGMPSLNKRAVEFAIRAGLSFESHINTHSRMDRKNYFYADLTKGYQISQDNIPICQGGFVDIHVGDDYKKINLERIHIEEDTGKLVHTEKGDTLIDYNRAGVPLIEIVTKPDMTSGEEAKEFLENLKARLKYIEVSDCKMEQGSMRCDVNINIIDEATGKRSKISEIKNLNSFRAVVKAIEYEEVRHRQALESGSNTIADTRRWDEAKGQTISMREKGEQSDYRYAADGDFAELVLDESFIEDIKKNLPELPHVKKARFMEEYRLSDYDAEILTSSRDLADFYELVNRDVKDSNLVSNWIMGDVLRRLKEEEKDIDETSLTSDYLIDLLNMIKEGKISNNIGKKVLRDVFESGKSPKKIVEEEGLIQISDTKELEDMVDGILDDNPQSIEDFKNGKDRALGFLVGQVMKMSRGKANPQIVNQIVGEKLKER